MAKFCSECGKEMSSGVVFCPECGTKATVESTQNVNANVTETAPNNATSPVVHTSQQQSNPQPQQVYTAPTANDSTNNVVGTGTFFGLMLLLALPIIGFIACIIMAFAPKNKNIKHFARATLIWTVIGVIIAGLLIGGIFLLSNTLMNYFGNLTDGSTEGGNSLFGIFGELGDIGDLGELENLGNLGDLGDLGELGDLGGLGDLEELQDLIEQFGNGEYGNQPVE